MIFVPARCLPQGRLMRKRTKFALRSAEMGVNMAGKTTNKRNSRAGSKNTSRSTAKYTENRTGSSGKKKNSSNDTMKLLLVLVVAGIAIAILILNQKDGESVEQTGGKGTPAPTAWVTPPEEGTATTVPVITPEPTPQPTLTPEPTKAPELTLTPEPTEQVPTPTPVAIAPEDARASIEQIVNASRYKIELLNDHLGIENREYYQFCISENGRELEPFLVVDKGNGSVWCYDASGKLSECRKFPLDDVGSAGNEEQSSDGTITAKKAYEVLCTYSKEKLGLAKEVKEYTPEYDSTLTLVKGVNCYRITLTEFSGGKNRNRGEFYISTDGKQCFSMDNDLGEFVPIP